MPKATLYMNGSCVGSAGFSTPKRHTATKWAKEAFKALHKVCIREGLTPGLEAFGPIQDWKASPEEIRMSFAGGFGLVIDRRASNMGT